MWKKLKENKSVGFNYTDKKDLKGCDAEIILNSFQSAFQNGYSLQEWRALLEKTIFTLSPAYDTICSMQGNNGVSESAGMTRMLSERQIITYNSALSNLSSGDIWQTICELKDFVKDFGNYKGRILSEIETVIIYTLCQQIVYQIRNGE